MIGTEIGYFYEGDTQKRGMRCETKKRIIGYCIELKLDVFKILAKDYAVCNYLGFSLNTRIANNPTVWFDGINFEKYKGLSICDIKDDGLRGCKIIGSINDYINDNSLEICRAEKCLDLNYLKKDIQHKEDFLSDISIGKASGDKKQYEAAIIDFKEIYNFLKG